ncbi:MAG: restriction endonuclease [Pseudomonadota bacterium]
MKHLFQRGNSWQFRRRVPEDIRSIIGKREWVISLGSVTQAAAIRSADHFKRSTDAEMVRARAQLAKTLQPSDREAIYDQAFARAIQSAGGIEAAATLYQNDFSTAVDSGLLPKERIQLSGKTRVSEALERDQTLYPVRSQKHQSIGFRDFMAVNGDLPIEEIKRDHVMKFVAECRRRDMSESTIKRRLGALGAVLNRYDQDHDITRRNPFSRVPLQDAGPTKADREPLTESQVTQFDEYGTGRSIPRRGGGSRMSQRTLWSIHMGRHHGARPLDESYIAIGWPAMGDLSALPPDRDAFKARIAEAYPETKKGAIPVNAGTLFRFVHEIKTGDYVLFPSKLDRMVYIGEIAGPYAFQPTDAAASNEVDDEICHQRPVKWLGDFPRTIFSQSALHEIGSFITLIEVRNHADEFLAALRGETIESPDEDAAETEAASDQVEETTEDFVIRRLKNAISAEKFEHFVAHLLECMGYHARLTQHSGDGGIDIIAHKDELGFEPPVIKVQCKQVISNIGRPDVQQLMGATEQQEFGLFVTLGGFTREALDAERTRPNLRLIDGAALTQLVFDHYDKFEPQWQTIIPLKRRYIPGPT